MNYQIEPIENRVISVKDEEIHWPFESSPYYYAKLRETYGTQIRIDPFPCYAHKRELVIEHATKVEATFPIGCYNGYFIFPFDTDGHTNGWATKFTKWNKAGEEGAIENLIGFSGKRIPLHPGMTRYLAAHEYGHCVQYWIEFIQKREDDKEGVNPFEQEYADIREVKVSKEYGGRRWHKAIGEIIVNDFRVIMTMSEPEFWPHEVDHPANCPKIISHWHSLKDKYAYNPETFDLLKMRAL